MAANVVAYPDIALEKFTGLDPSEDAKEFFSLIQRKIQFSLGTTLDKKRCLVRFCVGPQPNGLKP